jgi:hypothetical protein
MFRLGHSYLLNFAVEGEKETYEAVVEVPAEIERGKMYSVWVLADTRFPLISNRTKDPRTIKGRITVKPPASFKDLEVSYWASNSDYSFLTPKPDGSFELRANKLGGMLRVTQRVQAGHLWMYIKSVQKRELALPADADFVLEEDKLVSCLVKVPDVVNSDDLRGIALKIGVEDRFPLAWVNIRRDAAAQARFAKDSSVEFVCIPRKYYVVASYRGSVDGKPWVRHDLLGTLDVPKEGAGKMLSITPPTKEEALQGEKLPGHQDKGQKTEETSSDDSPSVGIPMGRPGAR